MTFRVNAVRLFAGYLLILTGACASLDAPEPPLLKIDEDTFRLTATIRSIEDRVPVDGGVDIYLQDHLGATYHAHFPSMFTYPPPPPERAEQYTLIQTLRPGDTVTIIGPLRDSVIMITSITRT